MIREMLPKDYSEIIQLGSLLHPDYSVVNNPEEQKKNAFFHCYVYEENKKLIGFLSFTKIIDNIDIIDIVVNPDYRRKKIATFLLDYMITNTQKEDKIFLEVRVSNTAAINLYKKMNFEIISTRKNYYNNEDAYVMERWMEDE